VKQLTGSTSEMGQSEKMPEDDPQRRCPDITKAREKLGWEPKTSFEELMKIMVEADLERFKMR